MSRRHDTTWLDHLRVHLAVARDGVDPEGVHQVRVAARRLRVWLALAGHRALDEDLKWLSRGLGPLRDLDVLAAGPFAHDARIAAYFAGCRSAQVHSLGKPSRGGAGGSRAPRAESRGADLAPAAPYFARRHAEARRQALEVLDAPRVTALVQALGALPPLEPKLARKALRRHDKALRRAVERWRAARTAGEVEELEEVHRLRRALRRLRYANEWLELKCDGLLPAQDALGVLCDLAALRRFLSAYARDTGDALPHTRAAVGAGLREALALLAERLSVRRR